MRNNRKLVFLILLITISAFLLINKGRTQLSTGDAPANSANTVVPVTPVAPTIPSNWETYPGESFSIAYPEGLKLDDQHAGENTVKISFMGQKQIDSGRTQASLSDGYYVAVSILSPSSENLKSQAQLSRDNSERGCQFEGSVVSPLSQTQLADKVAYQYNTIGCFGDYTTAFVENNGSVYRVTQYFVGEDSDKLEYQTTTKEIISTLSFNN